MVITIPRENRRTLKKEIRKKNWATRVIKPFYLNVVEWNNYLKAYLIISLLQVALEKRKLLSY